MRLAFSQRPSSTRISLLPKELHGRERPASLAGGSRRYNDALGEEVAVYVERYFPPATKRAVENDDDNIVAAFVRRIDALS